MRKAKPGWVIMPRPIIRVSQPVTSRQRRADSTLLTSPLATTRMGCEPSEALTSAMRSQYTGGL